MQNVSAAYKKSMRSPNRNRGYIKVRIGIINSKAQDNVGAKDSRNSFTYFSDSSKPFNDYSVDKVYATFEQDFTKVDGSMYFLPAEDEGMELYNNGIVTNDILGAVYIDFGGQTGFDIKGLTIDFGEYYPTEFTVESDSGANRYENNSRIFVTENVFYGTSYFIIRPSKMVNGQGALRINKFFCGIINNFTNKEVLNYTMKEHVSSITESISSQDVTLEVDNQNLYYSVDNPNSAFQFMETGQEVKTSFGYDINGDGNITWLPESTTYLKSWSANDVKAKFTATDRFDFESSGTYYRGLYRENGISLYDLAVDVLNDAGVTDEREYYIDPYLKKVIVHNPMPAVKHSEALQIIANAGRCALYEDRSNRIHLQSSFVPEMSAEANNMTEWSRIDKLLKSTKKQAYAIFANDFSTVDGSTLFMPENPEDYVQDTGYVSKSVWWQVPKGSQARRLSFRLGGASLQEEYDYGYWIGEMPKITINLEAGFTAFGLMINFRSVAPQEFQIKTYYEGVAVEERTVKNPDITYITHEEFSYFDKMELIFTRGYPHAPVAIDNILIGDVTDYVLSWKTDLNKTPIGTKQEKVRSINIKRSIYQQSKEEIKELVTEETILNKPGIEMTVYFSNPSYGLSAAVQENDTVRCKILESSNYYAKILFTGNIQPGTVVKYVISGYEYVVSEQFLKVQHNATGAEKEWSNPLVSSIEHAKDLEEWLASYYLGEVDYSFQWRGDPASDANDLFYLDLKDREHILVRAYEHNLKFNGAWSCTTKARRVVMSWQ